MSTFLPQDSNDNPIPALRLKAAGAHAIAASAVSARNATTFDAGTRVISVYAEQPVYLKFGDASAVATTSDHYFPSGVYYDFAIGGDKVGQYSHVAVVAFGTDGNVYISEKE